MAIPAWKLQLQQNIAKKKVEKIKQEEQRRIQMLPPWKRAAIEQQTQSKNVIIIPNNSTSTSKSTSSSTVSTNATTKTQTTPVTSDTSPRSTSVNSVNSKASRTVSIIPVNQKSPTHINNKTSTSGSGGGGYNSGNRVPLKHTGKSQSVDAVDGGRKVSSNSFNGVDEFGVSDEHCISVHNNPFLRQEKKTGVAKTNAGNVSQGGLGNRQKVQDSTSPTASKATTPRVAWNGKPATGDTGTVTTKSNNTKNNFITEKQKPATLPASPTKTSSPTRNVTFKSSTESKVTELRPSRSTERKLSVSEILSRFGRAASHDEKEKVRRQGSIEEPISPTPSPRSKSSNTRSDYGRGRERSPSPVRNRFKAPSKPRPKSSPVEIPTSVILTAGRSPTTSPQPVRRATFGSANKDKAAAPKAPVSSSSNKIVINTSNHKQQAPKAPTQNQQAPTISVTDKSSPEKSPVSLINNDSAGGVVLLSRKHLATYDTHDAGRTPPPRRKTPLPASAIIDLSTAGPIQKASGKPPADPEQIAKEKAASVPENGLTNGTHIKSTTEPESNEEKPKPNTVSNLLGAFGQNKTKAPSAPPALVKEDIPDEAIPYPEDFRRPKSWQEKQKEKETLPSQVTLKQTKPVNSVSPSNDTNSSIARSSADKPLVESLSPIPKPASETLSPIPKSETVSPIPKSETVSPIPKSESVSPKPNSEIISSAPKTVTQNGHISQPADPSAPKGKGEASQEMMDKAKALKKKKKIVNYEVIGGNAPTGKPSMQIAKSGRNRNKSKLVLTFSAENEEFEYQSEQSLLAEYGEYDDDEEEDEPEERHSSVSEDEDPGAPPPSGFKANVPKGTGGLQSYTPSYLRDLTPSMMREQQEASRRKEEAAKQPEPEPEPLDDGDYFSSAGSASAAMLF